jgi:hypothetical protein
MPDVVPEIVAPAPHELTVASGGLSKALFPHVTKPAPAKATETVPFVE